MTNKIRPTLSSWLARWRWSIQSFFVVVWLFPFIRLHSICSPVFHCYACPLAAFACPIGVIAQFSALHLIPFLAIGTLIAMGALLGTFICGYVCPFGFLQDLVGKIPVRKFHLPRWTGYFRYVVLIGLVIMIPFFFSEKHPLFICRVCPAGALEASVPLAVQQAIAGQAVTLPNAVKMVILTLFLLAMLVKMRPWCRLFCPLGAIFGLFNRFSAVYMKVDRSKCHACHQCQTKCRYGVVPGEELQSTDCVRCMECVDFRCNAFSGTTVLSRKKEEKGDSSGE